MTEDAAMMQDAAATEPVRPLRNSLPVIARSPCDEAIQTVSAAKLWIALRSQWRERRRATSRTSR
ncbi:hypothetical protein XH80_33455 [Bradyrhizobium sp. CCBAU 45384]|nr:hypothetical protein [Bradyrhizobium sp. CCBAU 45384]